MKNLLQIEHEYFSCPDTIVVYLNDEKIYSGLADIGKIDFVPAVGLNVLRVMLDKKHPENFQYDSTKNQVLKDSKVRIKEIIVENRYFRSLTIKCGLVEIDIAKNLTFPSKYIDHENCLTMEGSVYLIKFEFPIKNWMQIHLHRRNLDDIKQTNQQARDLLDSYQEEEKK
jgi:hypothetical protein